MPRKTGLAGIPLPPRDPRFNEAAARCRGKRWRRRGACLRSTGFNEAAARCRGKLGAPGGWLSFCIPASMRPRPDAAENGDVVVFGATGPTLQ